MKKVRIIMITGALALALGCSKSDNSEGTPADEPNNQNPDPTALTYQNDIRPIIQSNCVSCHGNPPTNNAPMSLTSLTLVRNAIETRGLISRINSTTNPMPPDGLMAQNARTLIAEWANQGFPE
ncbi:hypothetical protein SAMN06265375_10245 [Muriicola jejuensis]|uniref:Cytochrome c domain-containing protein n=1 Tax=Muriicola jejuensis TaxID=504488 RepID=A0A6P0UEC0_9FLAO|nr:hypothetical protein [Muriicola jejuensis]NER10972.1 hypothetical protein [Muriicola jejuensis]SMP15107.1 hypothetical protein SAMN06265375_10245 [Muriicola jejuensis]